MKKILKYMIAVLLAVAAGGCVYDYVPEDSEIQGLDRPLVVIDGDIIIGGITNVAVSLTTPLLDTCEVEPLGGTVWVESQTGEIFYGTEVDPVSNRFEINTTDLDISGKYRLVVSLPDRGEYTSAFKSVLVSPPVDKITYSIPADRSYARIEVTTHSDNNGGKLYCKWKYSENWESNALFPPELDYDVKFETMYELPKDEIQARSICFSEAESFGTYIGNTEKLSQNLIDKFVINDIANTDTRLTGLYSIDVKQTALDKEAYIYWENVRKNSSETGGLFGPQPSEVKGNIDCTTFPEETVIGYVNVTTQTTLRTFIDWSSVGIFHNGYERELVQNKPAMDEGKEDPGNVYWNAYYSKGYRPVMYPDEKTTDKAYWALQKCTDCRVYSNSTRPDFWPR